jgi:hypothetical protein
LPTAPELGQDRQDSTLSSRDWYFVSHAPNSLDFDGDVN